MAYLQGGDEPIVAADPFHDFNLGSFGGVPAAQYWCDFLLWEAILNSHPEVQGIIEIGTFQGGFSRYLIAQAAARHLRFDTLDSVLPTDPPLGFTRLDVFRYPEQVAAMANGVSVALFCDGGNKARELRTFPPLMPAGSIFLVHDWGTEMLPTDVPDFLEEIHGEFCDELGSVTRVFRMKP